MKPAVLNTVIASVAAATPANAQQGDGKVSIPITIFKPAKVQATPERIAALRAPAGFSVTPFATDLKNARILAVAPDGTVYLSRRDQGDVLERDDVCLIQGGIPLELII